MASPGLTKALEKLDRMQTHARNLKVIGRIREERMYGSAAAIAGAIAAGVADAKYRDPDNTDKKILRMPVVAVAGAAAVAAGFSEWTPGSFYVGMVGLGVLSYKIGKYAHDKTVEHEQTK